jgi:hypothetical protein
MRVRALVGSPASISTSVGLKILRIDLNQHLSVGLVEPDLRNPAAAPDNSAADHRERLLDELPDGACFAGAMT